MVTEMVFVRGSCNWHKFNGDFCKLLSNFDMSYVVIGWSCLNF